MIRSPGLRHNVLQRTQQIMNGDECILLQRFAGATGLGLGRIVSARPELHLRRACCLKEKLFSRAINGSYIFLSPTLQIFLGIMHGLFWVSCFPSTIF